MEANEFRYDVVEALDITRTKLQQDVNPSKEDLKLVVTAVGNTRLANVKDEVDRILDIIDSDNFDSQTVKSDVLKLLDTAIANQAAIGAGRRRRGKKTRKGGRKGRRMTRRRGGVWNPLNLFAKKEEPKTMAQIEEEMNAKAEKALGPEGLKVNAIATGAEARMKPAGGKSRRSRRYTRRR